MLDGVANRMERYLDLVSARQQLVTANIANADTPGYKTRDIDFQSEFRNATAESGSIYVTQPELKVKNDGNNVNLDREARLLAENSMRFNIVSQLLRSQVRTVRMAIQEGRNA